VITLNGNTEHRTFLAPGNPRYARRLHLHRFGAQVWKSPRPSVTNRTLAE